MHKQKLLKINLLSSLLLLVGLLSACATKPPNVPVCTPIESADYFEMQKEFIKLCSESFSCQEVLPFWLRKFAVWTIPSEAGFCIMTITNDTFIVDTKHKFNDKAWAELDADSIRMPAKESWSPMKTAIQSMCHQSGKCGAVGNWEGKIKALDQKKPLSNP